MTPREPLLNIPTKAGLLQNSLLSQSYQNPNITLKSMILSIFEVLGEKKW